LGAARTRERFAMPSATEIREMQTLEQQREQNAAQQHRRDQERAQVGLSNASLCANLLIQVPAAIAENKALIDNARGLLELYTAKVLAAAKVAPEEEEAEPEFEPLGGGDGE
jgi:hypothetical protein